MTSSRASQFTLAEFAAAFATAASWQAYQAVRHVTSEALWKTGGWDAEVVDPRTIPYDDPEAAAAYRRRCELEREFVALLIDPSHVRDWIIEAREEDDLAFSVVDARVLKGAKFDFARNVIYVLDRRLVDVCIQQTLQARSSRRFRGDHRHKQQLRDRIEVWLRSEAQQGAVPRSKPQWRLAAKAEFPEDAEFITVNLFQTVWRRLKHPFAIKLGGRPAA